MRLFTISLASTLVGILLCWSCLETAKQIAKATVPRIEMELDQ